MDEAKDITIENYFIREEEYNVQRNKVTNVERKAMRQERINCRIDVRG